MKLILAILLILLLLGSYGFNLRISYDDSVADRYQVAFTLEKAKK